MMRRIESRAIIRVDEYIMEKIVRKSQLILVDLALLHTPADFHSFYIEEANQSY